MFEPSQSWLSLAPLLATLALAFLFRNALIAMIVGALLGSLMLGMAPGSGLDQVLRTALGNGDFIWICEIVILIGLLFRQFQKAGVLAALARRMAGRTQSRRGVSLSVWAMGFAIIDDYLSPLLTGAIMRPLSDRAGIPREKLAFLLDSTTACVCILVPFTAWGAYLASLIAAQSSRLGTAAEGLPVFIAAIPWNFYPLLLLLFALLIAGGWVPDFGPMRRAERRVRQTGQLLRPGARPLVTSDEIDAVESTEPPASLLFELAVPVLMLIGVAVWSIRAEGAVRIVEAFMLANVWLLGVLLWRRRYTSVQDVGEAIVGGAASVMPALLVVAFAYALNAVTVQLGAGDYLIARFFDDLTPNSLVVLTFVLSAAISFATGTSWGTFAMMMPVALPFAFEFSDGSLDVLVFKTVAAVAGGGIFGDHASPVSDTSVLSSVGAGSDHMDHVITQLPYALLAGGLTVVLYLLL